MDKRAEIQRILDEHRAVLIRKTKHEVWRFPDGKTYVQSSTPSDRKAVYAQLSDLKKLLGLQSEHREGERRTRKRTNGRNATTQYSPTTLNTSLADQLLTTGVAASVLKDENEVLKRQIEMLSEPQCWFCKLRDWWYGKRTF